MPYIGDGLRKPVPQGSQIQRSPALVNLHGVATAQGDVRLGLALKIGKVSAAASPARGISGRAERLEAPAPNIARDKPGVKSFFATSEKLECFRYFE